MWLENCQKVCRPRTPAMQIKGGLGLTNVRSVGLGVIQAAATGENRRGASHGMHVQLACRSQARSEAADGETPRYIRESNGVKIVIISV